MKRKYTEAWRKLIHKNFGPDFASKTFSSILFHFPRSAFLFNFLLSFDHQRCSPMNTFLAPHSLLMSLWHAAQRYSGQAVGKVWRLTFVNVKHNGQRPWRRQFRATSCTLSYSHPFLSTFVCSNMSLFVPVFPLFLFVCLFVCIISVCLFNFSLL